MIISALLSLAFADDTAKRTIVDQPPTPVQLADELNKLHAGCQEPKSVGNIKLELKNLETVGWVPCTTVDGQNEICSWRSGQDVGFTADSLGPYRRWETAVPEQLRRLKVLNGG